MWLIFAKFMGILWMLTAFFVCLRSLIYLVNKGNLEPFPALLAASLLWIIIGLAPVAIVNFGWRFIS